MQIGINIITLLLPIQKFRCNSLFEGSDGLFKVVAGSHPVPFVSPPVPTLAFFFSSSPVVVVAPY